MSWTIRRDDNVLVIAGREKGKKGKVLQVRLDSDRLIIQGVNFMKKALRPSRDFPQGGVQQVEGSLHISNVKLICPRCNNPTRAHRIKRADGKRVRVCKKCKEEL